MRTITTYAQAEGLAEEIASKRLLFPAVLVSKPSGSGHYYEHAEMEAALGDAADVYFIDDDDSMRRAFEKNLRPEQMEDFRVFGGAVRVYPAGDWMTSPALFLAYDKNEAASRIPQIAAHLRRITARRKGTVAYSTSTSEKPKPAEALRTLDLEADVRRLTEANAALRQRALAPKPRAPKAKADTAPAVRARMFLDGADEISHRAPVQWAESTTPQQKLEEPMPELVFGPSFGETVEEIAGNDAVLLDKVARAVLNVAMGRSREAHKLGFTREDGAVSWRAYVEQRTPSARRLHFFRLPGGGLEFSRVVLHDDYTP